MPRICSAVLIAWCLAVSPSVSASIVEPMSFEQLVSGAERIFVGEVIGVESAWDGDVIRTHVTFRVAETVKGRSSILVRLTFLGGRVGERALEVSGMPTFVVGDEHVIFSVEQQKIVSPIVGFWHGQVRVLRDRTTGRSHVLRHDRTPFARAAALTQEASPATAPLRPLALEAFLADVRQAMRAGRTAR